MGRAFRQAPDSVVQAARRRAVDAAFGAESNKAKAEVDTFGAIPGFLAVGGSSDRERLVVALTP